MQLSLDEEGIQGLCINHQGMKQRFCADVTGGEWRLKYERAIREIEFTKKKLQQEFDDKLELEQQNKRQLDRRVSEFTHSCTPSTVNVFFYHCIIFV